MLDDFLGIFTECAVGAGHAGHSGCFHGVFGAETLSPIRHDGFRARADENETGFLDTLAKRLHFLKEIRNPDGWLRASVTSAAEMMAGTFR
jgi:hypothetical protein